MTDGQSVASGGPPDDPREVRRRSIVEAARRCFLEKGWDKTSVAAIVREAGVAQGTFYLYFPSKESVLASMRGAVLRDYIAAFESESQRDAPADERLVRGLRQIFEAVDRTRPLVRVFRQAASAAETDRQLVKGRRKFSAPLDALLQAGRDEGCFRSDGSDLSAHFILALFDNLLYDALEYDEPATGETVLTEGTRFMLRALGVAEARIAELLPLTTPDTPADESS